jgi:hypothetical protein
MRSFGSPIRRVFVNPTCILLSSMLKDRMFAATNNIRTADNR